MDCKNDRKQNNYCSYYEYDNYTVVKAYHQNGAALGYFPNFKININIKSLMNIQNIFKTLYDKHAPLDELRMN